MGKHEGGGRDPGLPENAHVLKEFGWQAALDPQVATRRLSALLDSAPKVLAPCLVSDHKAQEAGEELAWATFRLPLTPLLEAGKGGARRGETAKEWAMGVAPRNSLGDKSAAIISRSKSSPTKMCPRRAVFSGEFHCPSEEASSAEVVSGSR
jgi:hypothetical protein